MTYQGAILMEMCGWCLGCFRASVSSGCSLAALSLPVGIYTYSIMRALGTLSRALGGLAARAFSMVDGGVITGMVITCKTLSSTFFATDTTAFQAVVSTLCTNSSSYSRLCPVPLPNSLSVRLVMTEVI